MCFLFLNPFHTSILPNSAQQFLGYIDSRAQFRSHGDLSLNLSFCSSCYYPTYTQTSKSKPKQEVQRSKLELKIHWRPLTSQNHRCGGNSYCEDLSLTKGVNNTSSKQFGILFFIFIPHLHQLFRKILQPWCEWFFFGGELFPLKWWAHECIHNYNPMILFILLWNTVMNALCLAL